MKKTTKLVLAIAVSLFSFSAIMAQNHDHSKMDKKMKMDKKEYTCSMHPEVKSDKPGDCPKCGMALIEKKMDMKKGKMAKTYTCTMHPEITSDKPGDCSKCGMKLVEKKMKMN